MDIKGAIFDCDGTLIASLGFWEVLYEKLGEYYFNDKSFHPASEDDRAMRTQNAAFIGKVFHTRYGVQEDEERIAKRALDICEWYYRELVELKAGVRELLAHLKKTGVKICIASAAETDLIKMVLAKHDILDYFEGHSLLEYLNYTTEGATCQGVLRIFFTDILPACSGTRPCVRCG